MVLWRAAGAVFEFPASKVLEAWDDRHKEGWIEGLVDAYAAEYAAECADDSAGDADPAAVHAFRGHVKGSDVTADDTNAGVKRDCAHSGSLADTISKPMLGVLAVAGIESNQYPYAV